MIRGVVKPLLLGVVVMIATQFAGLLVYLVTSSLWPSTFPAMGEERDLGSQAWVNRLTVQFLGAAVLMLVLCWWLARFAHPRTMADGLQLGLLWAFVVGLGHLAIGLGNGTLGMFRSPGLWVMLVAIAVGPLLHVWWRSRRPVAASPEPAAAPASGSPAAGSSVSGQG